MTGPEAARQRAAEIPLELAGIDSPYDEQLRGQLDRALGIDDAVLVSTGPVGVHRGESGQSREAAGDGAGNARA
jgi:hypothetical protein